MHKLFNKELGRLNIEQYRAAEKLPLVLVLDNIRSGYNVGSIFRTADAFRVAKIYLCGICAPPSHKEVRKTALGATESVPWEQEASAIEVVQSLKEKGYEIWALEQAVGSTPLQSFAPVKGRSYAFILGNEVHGVTNELLEMGSGAIEIPQFGTKHSLNVAVSAGIVLWDFWYKCL